MKNSFGSPCFLHRYLRVVGQHCKVLQRTLNISALTGHIWGLRLNTFFFFNQKGFSLCKLQASAFINESQYTHFFFLSIFGRFPVDAFCCNNKKNFHGKDSAYSWAKYQYPVSNFIGMKLEWRKVMNTFLHPNYLKAVSCKFLQINNKETFLLRNN